jgi:hypothetical protein
MNTYKLGYQVGWYAGEYTSDNYRYVNKIEDAYKLFFTKLNKKYCYIVPLKRSNNPVFTREPNWDEFVARSGI